MALHCFPLTLLAAFVTLSVSGCGGCSDERSGSLALTNHVRSALVTEKIQSILQAKPLGVDAQLRRFHTAFRNDASKIAAA